jgi:2-succinyl-6-hydroxy-2,4-cyclohexadiene-1-carboxylate synthase
MILVPESVVLLHGFSGTRRAWDGVTSLLDRERYRPIALDLPGHGQAVGWEPPITFAGCVEHVLAAAPEGFALCGYSLGGRIALHVALAAPDRVRRLILVSSTAGIQEPAERAARRTADHRLAADLEAGGLEEFIARWRAQQLFAGEPPEAARLAREDQRRNCAGALADVLRGVGTGEMAPLWERLAELTMPVTVLVGEGDAKFTALGRRMVARLADAKLVAIPGGHNLPLENPQGLARALDDPAAEPPRTPGGSSA